MTVSQAYRLNAELISIDGGPAAGVAVSVKPAIDALVYPVGMAPETETLVPEAVHGNTDAAGAVGFDVLPSSVAGDYAVTVGTYSRQISMPEADARLSAL